MPDLIIFNMIATNGMKTNAAVMVGDNNATGWDANNKNQNGLGLVFGLANAFPVNINIINDMDLIDTPIYDGDVEAAPNAQA